MPVDRYRWASEFARRYVGLGRAWQEAQQDGDRGAVVGHMLTALRLRALAPSTEQERRIRSCQDLDVLEGWGLRLFEIETVDDLFV
ncbi:hypothetical protein IDM40_27545 [Nocardiopsis sp. HNM0947]|uniref:DUF4351 domain-containing protein n=2 Tax=Nocardiopsis coralli TaxID=2772213 RepID=A0ABR9PF16_9ACTN|nr:hypothetical protein [Nocardiopsis coralli]